MAETSLTHTESQQLATLEETIQRDLQTFTEVGNALLEIRDNRLYREQYGTFEQYCRDKWGVSKRRANQMVQAAGVLGNIENGNHGSQTELPKTERHARPLSQLPAEEQGEAWEAATQKAETEEREVTAKDVKKEVSKRKEPKQEPQKQEDNANVEQNNQHTTEKQSEQSELGKRRASSALQYAQVAIGQLDKIRDDDPYRDEALDKVQQWIHENK